MPYAPPRGITIKPFTEMRTMAILTVAAISAAVATGGCSRKVYVPVENMSHSTDTLTDIRVRSDTFLARDSVILFIRGDTVSERVVRERIRLRLIRDTVRDVRRDTVTVTRIARPEKEKPRGLLRRIGEGAGLLLAGAAAATVFMILFRRRTRGR